MAYIKLNKSVFFNNLDIISKKVVDINKIALVLKDNAYGHGLIEVATMAKEYGISKAVVRREEEAWKIKDFFKYILILSPIFDQKNSSSNFVYTINSLDDIDRFSKNSRVELKVDTGMHRNGIRMDELSEAFKKIDKKDLELEGVFTHFRSADAMSSEWFWQKKRFEKVKRNSVLYKKELRFHSCNSAALFRSLHFDEDMVRIGIAAYGCLKMAKGFTDNGLKPVLSLWADKISSRELKKGERIGYNATYEVLEDIKVSNYDIGYSDGLMRTLSNSYETPQGYKLLGRVSMDNSSYDSTQKQLLIFDDADKVATYCNTIAYEVLTSLSSDIKRIVVNKI